MKVTKEILEEMKKLRSFGWSYGKIARRFGLTERAVAYWLDPKFRARRIAYMRRYDASHRDRRREYFREYWYRRYHTDEEFRRRVLDSVMRYHRRRFSSINRSGVRVGSLLRCLKCGHVWETRVPRLPMRCPVCSCILERGKTVEVLKR